MIQMHGSLSKCMGQKLEVRRFYLHCEIPKLPCGSRLLFPLMSLFPLMLIHQYKFFVSPGGELCGHRRRGWKRFSLD